MSLATLRRALILGTLTTIGITACNDAGQPLVPAASPRLASAGTGGFSFESLASSATCTVNGGDPAQPFVLASGLTQTVLASEPSFADAPDMNTVNQTGPYAGRYLYRPTEGAVGQLSVTDLLTGETKVIAQRADWESMDAIVWSPWGTLLIGEETNAAAKRDPQYPNAVGGLLYEVFLDRNDPTTADSIVARPALGAKSHEGNRFDPQGNLYSISERNPGYVFRFVPDRRGDLSSGQLYALKVVNATGDRTGDAEWVALDRAQVQIDASAAAQGAGATGYNRPEDVEMATSTGNTRGGANTLYVAVTGASGPADNRVIAIDLREAASGADHATAFVYDYVRLGVNATPEFEWPDNLALDRSGNLYISEDPGGSFPTKTKGDDIWMAAPAAGVHEAASGLVRVASLTDCSAEPTGIYFSKQRERLLVNVQHRGGDRLDKVVAIESR